MPNLSHVINNFATPLTAYLVTTVKQDFQEQFKGREILFNGVISGVKDETIIKEVMDYSLQYYTLHTAITVNLFNQYVIYENVLFKVIQRRNYSQYGFSSYIIEEVKNQSTLTQLKKGPPC